MRSRSSLALLLIIVTAATLPPPASADLKDGRVSIAPTLGHISFDATDPWISIDATVVYGGRIGVMVNRWFGIDANLGYAFANGNYGYDTDGSGGFRETRLNGMDVDVLYFGMDLTFHPLEGRLDPWVLVGVSFLNYDYDFDAAGFKQWLSDAGATYNLEDLSNTSGFEFGLGVSYAYRMTENSRWSVVADFRDVMVSPKKLEIFDASGEQVLDGEYGHNLLVNVGLEFAWGPSAEDAAEE